MLKGEIVSIIYYNAENGYTILKVFTGRTEVIATGKFPILGVGEKVELEGHYEINAKYGEQFVATSVSVKKPTSLTAIKNYLASGLITGVGEITASNIVNMFGDQTLEIIEFTPEKLALVKGISMKKAGDIGLAFKDIKKMQEAVLFLQQYDVSVNLAVKIYNKYKTKTKEVLNKNPYQLVEDIDGIGFKTADRIAFNMGIEKDSQFRLRAGLLYTLDVIAQMGGSTIALKDELIAKTMSLLEIDGKEEILNSIIVSLLVSGMIKQVEKNGEEAYAISKFYSMEKYIAQKLKLLASNPIETAMDFEREIEDYQRVYKIELHSNQIEAIREGATNGVSIITGGPGTGKTTIVKAIIRIFDNLNLKVMLMAPTGRAAKRLEEQTGVAASTIHRALEMSGKGDGMFLRNEHNPLDADVVIVDEVSMIDDFVMTSLLKAVSPGARIVLVGDKDQLPSVGAGNVLADILASKQFKTVNLTQIFRQSEDSAIITNAHKINDGQMIDLHQKSKDFFYSQTSNPEDVKNEIVSFVTTRIPNYLGVNPTDIQVIIPMKSGICGVDEINKALQETLNPKTNDTNQIDHGKRIFRVGDKIMQIKNNYEQEWVKIDENGFITKGMGVFNGDVGYIEEINKQTNSMIVCFEDGRRSNFSMVDFDNLTHAYAITIHKSQGSEFKVVIIPILGGNPMLYNRNLLYTAVTRAKQMVVLIGKEANIFKMIKNEYLQRRNTMLKDFIIEPDYMFN